MTELRVTVAGPVGSGKSAVAGEIENALKALGVPVRYANEREAAEERNMTGADWKHYLEMYKPSVVIEEVQMPLPGSSLAQNPLNKVVRELSYEADSNEIEISMVIDALVKHKHASTYLRALLDYVNAQGK